MASKIHFKVVLDVFVVGDADSDLLKCLSECEANINGLPDDVGEVQDVSIVSVKATDSR